VHLATRLYLHEVAAAGHLVEVKPMAVRRTRVGFGEEGLPITQAHDLHAPGQSSGVVDAQAQGSRSYLGKANGPVLLGPGGRGAGAQGYNGQGAKKQGQGAYKKA
jgi:hypothetical protein